MGEEGEGFEGDDGGCAEDFAAVALGDELFGGGGVAVVEAEDVDFEHSSQILFGEIEKCFYLGNTSVCDHGGKRPEFRHGCLDEALDFLEIGHVGCVGNGFPS